MLEGIIYQAERLLANIPGALDAFLYISFFLIAPEGWLSIVIKRFLLDAAPDSGV
jgi:hypothetical protein